MLQPYHYNVTTDLGLKASSVSFLFYNELVCGCSCKQIWLSTNVVQLASFANSHCANIRLEKNLSYPGQI